MRWSRATARKRPKYAAARTFYLVILVTLMIAALTLVAEQSHGRALNGGNGWLVRREALAYEGGSFEHIKGAKGALMRRDEAVRPKFCFSGVSRSWQRLIRS